MSIDKPNRLVAFIVVIAVVAVGISGWALLLLDEESQQGALESIAVLAFQAVAIVILGTLIKFAIDDSRDRRHRAEELAREQRQHAAAKVDRRMTYIRRMVDASHDVDVARVQIWADRSVSDWSDQMNGIIRAFVDLRDIKHDLESEESTSDPVFENAGTMVELLIKMTAYLWSLINEYAEQKTEIVPTGESNDGDTADVWDQMMALPVFRDFQRGNEGYSEYRKNYVATLRAMRSELAAG